MKYWAFGQTIETELDFSDTLQVSQFEPTIWFKSVNLLQEVKRPTRIYRKGVRANYDRINEVDLLSWKGIVNFKIENRNCINFQNLGVDEGTLKLFVLSEALGISLWRLGYYLLHGSAVMINKEAYVFVGVPGAGKSTTATAFWHQGHVILSDDLVAIKFIEGEPFIIPAFPQLKVWRSGLEGLGIDFSNLKNSFEGIDKYIIQQSFKGFPTKEIPLRRVTILQKAKSNRSNGLLQPVYAPIELVNHFPLPSRILQGDDLKRHFQESLALGSKVQLVSQKRPRDFEALKDYVNNYGKL